MRTFMVTFVLSCACLSMQGQNLVPNYSFETYSACPNASSQIANATGWNYCRNTGEYLNSCSSSIYADVPTNYFGYQQAATGQAYIGGLMYGSFSTIYVADLREFFYVQLTTPLNIGTTYYVAFKVSLADNSGFAVNNIGAQFTTSYNSSFPINNTSHVRSTAVISDKTNWTTIIGSFVPTTAYTALMLGNFYTDANTTVTNVGTAVNIGYNAYYLFDDVYVGITLPLHIKLAEFNANNAGTQNKLHWKTTSEDEGDYFEIEHSKDGVAFNKIATVQGRYKTGGSYQLTDMDPVTGINYYRLKMTSKDGKFNYSKIVNAQVKAGVLALEIYPNPVSDVLRVRINGVAHGAAALSITDASGRVVRSMPVTGTSISIPLQTLPAGYYFLHYRDDLINEKRRIVKN